MSTAAVTQPLWQSQRAEYLRDLSASEIGDIAAEAGDSLASALRTGDSVLVGRVLAAAVDAQLDRWTDHYFFGETTRCDADSAARQVLLQASSERVLLKRAHHAQEARRFG